MHHHTPNPDGPRPSYPHLLRVERYTLRGASWSHQVLEISETFKYMRSAIEEGRKAIPVCGNNPPVGCVIIRNGEIIAKGHTNAPGKDHAEVMALNQLPNVNEGDALIVTLEPCSFQGRTPSCAKALVDSGIKSIYVGMLDPDPRNNGKGIAMLRDAGISVNLGILEEEILTELKGFLGKAP